MKAPRWHLDSNHDLLTQFLSFAVLKGFGVLFIGLGHDTLRFTHNEVNVAGQPREIDSDKPMDADTIEELEWKHPAELTEEETLALRRLPRLGCIQQTLVTFLNGEGGHSGQSCPTIT